MWLPQMAGSGGVWGGRHWLSLGRDCAREPRAGGEAGRELEPAWPGGWVAPGTLSLADWTGSVGVSFTQTASREGGQAAST